MAVVVTRIGLDIDENAVIGDSDRQIPFRVLQLERRIRARGDGSVGAVHGAGHIERRGAGERRDMDRNKGAGRRAIDPDRVLDVGKGVASKAVIINTG